MASRPRVRGQAKRDALLAAAWDVFRRRGYALASMDEITRRAGGSKVSLYAHFGDKERLFEAVVRQRAQEVVASLPPPVSGSLLQRLSGLASAMTASMTSPAVRDLHRVALSAQFESAAIGRLLYEHGTRRVLARVSEILAAEMKAGRLRADDPGAAAEALFGLIVGAGYVRFALGVPERLSVKQRQARVDRAARDFLAAYACPVSSGERRLNATTPRGATTRRKKTPLS